MTSGFGDLARRRRMTRHFLPDPVEAPLLSRVLDTARRVPSAGNAQGFDFVVLCGPDETARYWDAALPADRRDGFRWTTLLMCPVVVTVWADPQAYVDRYTEPDKERTGLGREAGAWTTPYWTVDAAFAAMALQYAAIDEGLGVLFFGMFEHAGAVAAALGIPSGLQPIGAVALGWPDLEAEAADGPAASQHRKRRPLLSTRRPTAPSAESPADPGPEAEPGALGRRGAPSAHADPSDAAGRPVVHRGQWLGGW